MLQGGVARGGLWVATNDLRPQPVEGREPMEPEKETSWLRLLITIAIDWRLVIAVLLLVLALLKR